MVEKKKNGEYGEFYESDVVKSTFIDGITFYSKPVQYTEVEGLAIFEGDIILGTVEEVNRKTEIRKQELRSGMAMGIAISGSQYRWPDCVIPYTIDPGLPNQVRVTDAIAHWESNTRYRFVLRTAENAAMYPDWVDFRPASGCSSYVGRQGGEQPINLGSGCTTGNTIHEIGHAVGLWHEHSREDRDSRVTINWDKIIPGREHNFSQHVSDGEDIGPYDYGSIMHYPRVAFSIDGSETITPTDPTAVIGQRTALSPGDIAAANSLCPSLPICPPAPIRCPPAPRLCPPGPVRCPPAPVRCPPGPRLCPPGPVRCPPAPVRCPPAPRLCPPGPVRCPPAPVRCPPAPRLCPPGPVRCPPAPTVRCPPSPMEGCLAGPYLRPGPRIPITPRIPTRPNIPTAPRIPRRNVYGYEYGDPYAYEYADLYSYDYGYAPCAYDYDPYTAYEDPYAYGEGEIDWTSYEYSDPYEESYYQTETGYEEPGTFDPRYY